MPAPYHPPFTFSTRLIHLVSRISEEIGRWAAVEAEISPRLRREHRIRSIHASLAIENNTLSLDQVTDIIEGKRVIGHPREIQEVHNALAAYNLLESLEAHSVADFLKAHQALMVGLADDAGCFRTGGVAVYQGEHVVHMAPPAERVPHLVADLFGWLENTDLHPLLVSAAVHYEIEFIHPYSDGNGRIGRLWQTIVLAKWKPQLAYLPVETVVLDRQADYYNALAASDRKADVAPFAEFILKAMLDGIISSSSSSDPASDLDSDPVSRLVSIFERGETLSIQTMMDRMQLRHRTYFRRTFLNAALVAKQLEMTMPDSPHHPSQRYRLTKRPPP